jgi:hypothetical protein
MNYDARGQLIIPSTPKTTLRKVKKVFHIDSNDRDLSKYLTCGDIVVYLPRVYERVISLRLMSAEFPPIVAPAFVHRYSNGQNIVTANFSNDASVADTINAGAFPYYFVIDIEGLNKTDECAFNANGSGFVNGFFGKISTGAGLISPDTPSGPVILYNDHSAQENIAEYSPPIAKLDRMHIRLRTHNMQNSNAGFLYWTSTGTYATTSNVVSPTANYSLTFELEYLDNGYDEYSSMQTSLTSRP